MKKHLVVIGMTLMLLAVGLSGCEELEKLLDKPDYIFVTVYCKVKVVIHNDSDTSFPAEGVFLEVEIIKAGGERLSEYRLTGANGVTTGVTEGFKLYREQPITCIANVNLESVEDYPEYTFNSASHTISWNEIYPQYDFGDMVTKNVNLVISGYKKEN